MLYNMFLYVLQHIFFAWPQLHFLHFPRDFAFFADTCSKMHKKHRYGIDNAPSPERRKGGLAPLSSPRGYGAHGAPHAEPGKRNARGSRESRAS